MRQEFFDANCFIGHAATPQPGAFDDADGLEKVMDRCGIGEALVCHFSAGTYDGPTGNDLLMDAIADRPRLHPCWVAAPHHTGRMPEPGELLERMGLAGVRAVRIFPLRVGPMREWLFGELLAALAGGKILTLIDFELTGWSKQQDVIDWDGLHWALGEWPELPMVLVRAGFGIDPTLLALMSAHDNLLVDTSYYLGTGCLERLVGRLGPGRVLFGTGMPVYAPGPAITVLTYSGLDEPAKALAAGGNLRRLLAAARNG